MVIEFCPNCGLKAIFQLAEEYHYQCGKCFERFAFLNVSDTVPYFSDEESGWYPMQPPRKSIEVIRSIREVEHTRMTKLKGGDA